MHRNTSERRVTLPVGWRGVAAVAGGLLLAYYVVPLLVLLVSQSPAAVRNGLADPTVQAAAFTSVTTASATTGISLVLGVPLAYWLANADVRGKNVLLGVLVLPLVLPPVVSGILLVSMIGPTGLGGALGVELTRTWVGVVLAQTFVASPFVVVTAMAAFEGIDRHLVEASRTLGHGPAATFRRVTLPLAWPGILAGATLTFARAIGEFGATMLVAYYPTTMPVAIWQQFVGRGFDAALPVAAILLAVSLVALVVVRVAGTAGGRWPLWE